jgi:hypothetical protein
VIAAGLLTGGVIAYYFVAPERAARYTPEHRVVESPQVPPDSAQSDAASPDDGSDAAPEQADDGSPNASADGEVSDAAEDDNESSDETATSAGDDSTAADRKAIHDARERMEAQGVEDYVELTERLYIRLSAKMVIMASTLDDYPDAQDPAVAQGLMSDYAAGLLADARVNPDEFYEYTREVHSDPERAKEMGERILREAEKHTDREIDVSAVPGMSPTPVPESEQQ